MTSHYSVTAGSSKGSSRAPTRVGKKKVYKKKGYRKKKKVAKKVDKKKAERRSNSNNLNNDCKYFFGGCDCEYRHSEAAKGCWTMCPAWAQGTCEEWGLCTQRHMDQKKLILQRREFISKNDNKGAKTQNGGKRARLEEVIDVDEDSYDEEEDEDYEDDEEEVAEEEEEDDEENYDDEEDVEEKEEVDEEDAEEEVKNVDNNEAEGRTECPVCFGNKAEDDDLQFCAFIECGHVLCETCASDLRKEKPAFCPLCRWYYF